MKVSAGMTGHRTSVLDGTAGVNGWSSVRAKRIVVTLAAKNPRPRVRRRTPGQASPWMPVMSHRAMNPKPTNETMIARHPDTAAKKARFIHFLKESGGDGRKDIKTYFDLIEFDEGRLK